jgi:hypothetical protein
MADPELQRATWTMPAPEGFVWTEAGVKCLVGQPILGMAAVIVEAEPVNEGTAVEVTAEMPELPSFLGGPGVTEAGFGFRIPASETIREKRRKVPASERRLVALVFSIVADDDDEAYRIGEELLGQIYDVTDGDATLQEIDLHYGVRR